LTEEDLTPTESPPKSTDEGFPWASLALYVMGILTGVLLFAAFSLLSGRGPFARVQSAADPLAIAALGTGSDIRSQARDGTLDAIATLEARANTPPTPAATPTDVPLAAFAIRDANREGSPDAPVTIVEFSDFQ
jgi:protein-disulfide isomerase